MLAWQCRACKGPPLKEPWYGQCPNCGGLYRANKVSVAEGDVEGAEIQPIEEGEPISIHDAQAQITEADFAILETGMPGTDWILGGGVPWPSSLFLSGASGAGKSTLLIEIFRKLAFKGHDVLYCQTEESIKQIAVRYKRLGKFPQKHFKIVHQTDLSNILETIEKEHPKIAAIDSLQGIEGVSNAKDDLFMPGSLGSVTQAAREIKKFSDCTDCAVFIVGHVTKEEIVAGTNTVKHIFDGTLFLHKGLTDADPTRILEAQGKMRFAQIGRKSRFEMRDTGLIDLGPEKDL